MAIDREALKRRAMRVIDQASDAELQRARRDEGYAHDWLQSLIGWIANLVTILRPIFFGCHITTAVVDHFDMGDDSPLLSDLRSFRDEYFINGGISDRMVALEKYRLTAPAVLRWINGRPDSDALWELLRDGVLSGHRAVKAGEYEYASKLFEELGADFQINAIIRPSYLRRLIASELS